MRRCAALLAVVLAIPASAAAQAPARARRAGAEAQPSAAPPPRRRRILAGAGPHQAPPRAPTTPLRDAAEHAPEAPTFRTSVTEHVDIWKFWGEPDDVAAYVRPSGGTWHNEFQTMVTPDEFKGAAGLGNGEQLQLAATSLAFAGAMKLLGIGVQQVKQAAAQPRRAQGEGRSAARARGVLRPAPRGRRTRHAAVAGPSAAPRPRQRSGGNSARSTSGARRAQSASECRPPATSR